MNCILPMLLLWISQTETSWYRAEMIDCIVLVVLAKHLHVICRTLLENSHGRGIAHNVFFEVFIFFYASDRFPSICWCFLQLLKCWRSKIVSRVWSSMFVSFWRWQIKSIRRCSVCACVLCLLCIQTLIFVENSNSEEKILIVIVPCIQW